MTENNMHFSSLNYGFAFTILALAIIYLSYSPIGNAQPYDENFLWRNVDALSWRGNNRRCGEYTPALKHRSHKTGKHRVAGGRPVSLGQYPSYVAIRGKHLGMPIQCAGTIIHRNLILTARHCGQFLHEAMVAAGLNTYQDDVTYADQYREFDRLCKQRTFPHENNLLDDIVIIKVKKPFDYNDNVGAACMDFEIDTANPIVLGPLTDGVYDRYKAVPIHAIKLRKCNASDPLTEGYVRNNYEYTGYRCFEPVVEKTGTACQGDLGAGIYIQNKALAEFVGGVVSEVVNPKDVWDDEALRIPKQPQCEQSVDRVHVVPKIGYWQYYLMEMMEDCITNP